MAAEGKFVTRVIYVEDPHLAMPISEESVSATRWIDVRPGGDLLVTADSLGRPIAILRMGGRVPGPHQVDAAFMYCSPPVIVYDDALKPPQEGVILAPHRVPVAPTE
jgi:hypothetical protein